MEWIFSKLDSGFQSLVGFRILSAGFRIPKPRIPDSTSKKFLDSGIRIPLHGAILSIPNHCILKSLCCSSQQSLVKWVRWKPSGNLYAGCAYSSFFESMWRHLEVPILYLQDLLGIINGTTGFYSKTMSAFPMHSLRLKNLDLNIGLISAFLRFLLSSEI